MRSRPSDSECALAARSPRLTAAAVLLAGCAAVFAQSAPPADQNTASVAGVVLNSATGEPVLRAHVLLVQFGRGQQQQNYGALTTADGKFSITGLAAGNYGLSVNRLGFFWEATGANGLALKEGDHKDDLALKLTPAGAISGTVVDADGEPVDHCNIQTESNRGGQNSQSDSQGRFRIGGLAPGKYRVKAAPSESQTPPEIRTDGTAEANYSETYYPSSLDAVGGARIAVEAGNETSGIEIRLVRTPVVRVSGRVTGLPQGAESVYVNPQRRQDTGSPFLGMRSFMAGPWGGTAVKKDGTFTLWRLPPGPYRIGLQTWTSPAGVLMGTAPSDVVVGDTNIDGIELRMVPAADVTGQVTYESEDARPPETPANQAQPRRHRTPQLFLQGIDGTFGAASGQVDAGGAFTLTKVLPGRYHVMWNGSPGYVKSVRVGTADVAGDILDLSSGAAGVSIGILISAQYGSISGTVDTGDAPVTGLQVMLLPDGEQAMGRGFQFAPVDASGKYTMGSVVPGAYKLLAVPQEKTGEVLQGGDAWETYAPAAESVTVAAGDKLTQDLKLLQQQ